MPADNSINEIKRLVLQAFKEGKLSTYERPTPSGEALELLAQARRRIEEHISHFGPNLDALRLLALIQESLKQYASAIETLQRVIDQSNPPNRDDLKRLAMCRQNLLNTPGGQTEE